jgi:UrcA family protein
VSVLLVVSPRLVHGTHHLVPFTQFHDISDWGQSLIRRCSRSFLPNRARVAGSTDGRHVMKCSLVAFIAVFAALCRLPAANTSAPDRSGPSDSKWDTRIHFEDLDLSKSRDVGVLYGHISRAARDVCGPSASYFGRLSLMNKCVERTVEDAVSRINRPQLTALHQAHEHPGVG